MPETYEFISQNLDYFYSALQPLKNALAEDGPITFISHESQWSFAVSVEKSELGRVASGSGVISEGGACPYDDLSEAIS
ncbi:hypothetical protein [Rubritalea sp.]|uniref:hypothetical protein n=1 Tax=Rubritalea sp. TaxID=2109375 RepID=UPI003EF9E99B